MRIGRTAVLIGGTLACGFMVGSIVQASSVSGTAQLISITDRSDGSLLVMVYGMTFVAPAMQADIFKSYQPGEMVPYAVTLLRKTADGLPKGVIGRSS